MSTTTINVAVIGAGSWGTTVAALAAVNTPTVLWARRSDLAREINDSGVNPEYLPNFTLPDALHATDSLADAVSHADVVVMAVPSHGYRDVAVEAAASIRPWVPVVSLSKGLERTSLKRMSEVTADAMPGHPVAVLTGPNLAKEILSGQPAASVVAIDDTTIADELQRIFSRPSLRVYTNADVVGCEVAGVVKNVIAIAAGMAEGMGFGDNTRATLITRGLAEMTRLGVAMGANPMTFAGLAGIGDILATSTSALSRNHRLGVELAAGRSWSEIEGTLPGVAEGAYTVQAAVALAEQHHVEMPIAEQVHAVLYEGKDVRASVIDLLARSSKDELTGEA